MVTEKEIIEETPFNMAMLYYLELHKLREFKSRAILENNLLGYCDALEEIFIAISFKLSTTEVKEIQNKFKEIKKDLGQLNIGGSVGERIGNLVFRDVKGRLREIDIQLIGYLNKYNMIFPKIEMGSLSNIEKRFNLDGGNN